MVALPHIINDSWVQIIALDRVPWIQPPSITVYPGQRGWATLTLVHYPSTIDHALVACSLAEFETCQFKYWDRRSRIRIGLHSPLSPPPGCISIDRFGLPFPGVPCFTCLDPPIAHRTGVWLYTTERPLPTDCGVIPTQPAPDELPSCPLPQIDEFWSMEDELEERVRPSANLSTVFDHTLFRSI
jgi:hypothetical protein